mmetsp:Transcript_12453/g.23376  ORF Transcript_12453/g.23376 Transcript_12453/m.23376 type:complete len:84 (+) Transcript_12453:1885-2136(+)
MTASSCTYCSQFPIDVMVDWLEWMQRCRVGRLVGWLQHASKHHSFSYLLKDSLQCCPSFNFVVLSWKGFRIMNTLSLTAADGL